MSSVWDGVSGISPNGSVSCDRNKLIRFGGQKVEGQGPCMTKYAKNTILRVCFRDISGVLQWIFSKLFVATAS